MIYKFFADTRLDIDPLEKTMLFTRGHWNFKQVELNYSGEGEKASEEILKQFSKFSMLRYIDSEELIPEYNEFLEKLAGAGILYNAKYNEKVDADQLLIITDDVLRLGAEMDSLGINAVIESKYEIIDAIFENKSQTDTKQNPLILFNITERIHKKYANIKQVFIVLAVVDDAFFRMYNSTFGKLIPTMYAFLDKDFAYIFDVDYKYTGCYECFSMSISSKSKALLKDYEVRKNTYNKSKYSLDHARHLNHYKFLISLVAENIQDYLNDNIVPCFGRLVTVFLRSMEIHYENLYRIPFCSSCGYVSEAKVEERNVKMQNLLTEVFANELSDS